MDRKTHVLITGASSGIGASLALLMAEKGYRVSACARRMEKLEALQTQNAAITPIQMDVSEQSSVAAGLDAAVSENGRDRYSGAEMLVFTSLWMQVCLNYLFTNSIWR